jgi:hypothetical protein
MAVIINDMEVVVEAPAAQQPAAAAPPTPPPMPIKPLDVQDILARRNRQQWRLMAH